MKPAGFEIPVLRSFAESGINLFHADVHQFGSIHRQGYPGRQGDDAPGSRLGRQGGVHGVSIKDMYWTLGQYDQICVFEAPDDETAASVLLAADILGNIRTQTMRAFTTSEMEKILAKVP
jgi:GYD domain